MKTLNEFLKEAEELILKEDAPVVVSGGENSVGSPEPLEKTVKVKQSKGIKGLLLNVRKRIKDKRYI